MFNVTGAELVIIFLVALVVLGPDRLPAAARTVGKILHQVREVSNGFQKELKAAVDEVVEPVQSLTSNLSLIDNTATPDPTVKPLSAPVPLDAGEPGSVSDPDPDWSTPPRPQVPGEPGPGRPDVTPAPASAEAAAADTVADPAVTEAARAAAPPIEPAPYGDPTRADDRADS
jgi:sec-independent protein translocase protein TatB